jgi:hypothetical protein
MKHQTQSAEFPLLRDLPSLGCATILGISPYLVYSQWFGIRDLYLAMFRQKLISFRDDIPEAERLFRREVASANDYFATAGRRSSVAMAIAEPLLAHEDYRSSLLRMDQILQQLPGFQGCRLMEAFLRRYGFPIPGPGQQERVRLN